MKKFFLLLAVALLATTSVSAQLLQFGVTGDIAFIKEDKPANYSVSSLNPGAGWSLGVKAKVHTPLGLGADGAIKYATEGVAFDILGQGTVHQAVVDEKLSYIAVPLNARYDLSLPIISRVVCPFVFAGPEFRYTVTGVDFKNIKNVAEAGDTFKENKANWYLNLGVGAILLKHLEVAYQYSIRETKAIDFKSIGAYKEIESRYKKGVSKIMLTYYF